jgi:hypothetical protein
MGFIDVLVFYIAFLQAMWCTSLQKRRLEEVWYATSLVGTTTPHLNSLQHFNAP